MKYTELIIRNFGQISNRRVKLHDGINLFYGENESGKTTIHTFIKSMLFGMERLRGRAAAGDTFSRYQPWEQPNYYAGAIRFESGGKHFLLERNFDKYTKSVRLICEDDGEEFSPEHGDLEMLLGGLSADNYDNTVSIGQMKVETGQSLAAELQNYATNYYATGQSDMDLDGALGYLNQQKKEADKEIRGLLRKRQEKQSELEREADYVWRDIHKLEEKLQETENLIAQEMDRQAAAEEEPVKTDRKWRIHPIELGAGLLLLLLVIFLVKRPWNLLAGIVTLLGEAVLLWNRLKDGKPKKEENSEPEKESENTLEKLVWEKEHLTEEWKEKKIQHSNLMEQLADEDVTEGEKEQDLRKQALELASARILELSKDVHRELSEVLNERTSAILSEITGGKYTRLLVDEKLGMSILTKDRKVSLEQLSRGTIEQIYFALRMAAGEILCEEEFPIVLDDTFVYYDDERLKNTLHWLEESGKQVLLFTCHKREGSMLNTIS